MRTRLLLASALPILAISCGPPPNATPARENARVVATYSLDAAQLGEADGVIIRDGGYSSLTFDSLGRLWTLTDRGPNLDASVRLGAPAKRFPLPAYHPAAKRLKAANERLEVEQVLPFVLSRGQLATGLPPPQPTTTSAATVERALGLDMQEPVLDADGIDSEGIAFGAGSLWIGDEYRPSIWRINPSDGRVLARYTPTPSDAIDVALPQYLLERRPNLGFEGIAYLDGYLYAALQAPLSPAGGDSRTRIVRILRINVTSGEVRAFAYGLDGSRRKIGDLAVAPDGQRLLVLEHGIRGEPLTPEWSAEVYALSLKTASILDVNDPKPPENYRDGATALINGVSLVAKILYVDLSAAGWPPELDKPEGLAVDDAGRLLVVNDNDYGIISPDADGTAVATGVGTIMMVVE